MGWVAATTLGRVWMVALAVLLVGLLVEREAGLAAAVLAGDPVHGPLRLPLPRPGDDAARGAHRMTRWHKVLLGFGIYFAVIVAVFLIFGSDGENESFQPQNEFKLEPWIHIKIVGIDMSINKAVLYLVLASARHDRDDDLHREAHAGEAEPGRRPRSSSPTT